MATYKYGFVENIILNTLAIRFGTYGAISYIGDDGYNADRINEYSYLLIHGPLDSRPSEVCLAGQAFSHKVLKASLRFKSLNDHGSMVDIYKSIGKSAAKLIAEVERFGRINNVCFLGSDANGIDEIAFQHIKEGIADFGRSACNKLSLKRFVFMPSASHQSSLIGAAMEHSERLAVLE